MLSAATSELNQLRPLCAPCSPAPGHWLVFLWAPGLRARLAMSAAAPPSPAIVRAPSNSRRPQPLGNNSPSDRPHRSQSTTTRPITQPQPPSSPHRSASQSQSHARPPHSPHAHLANVARRDFEQSNIASSTSRRSSSRDGTHNGPPTPRTTDSTRSTHRSSRAGHSRYASDASTAPAMPINGVATDHARPAPAVPPPKRRTTISAPNTGQWSLGKTIGAGSMGKVKLAKSATTGEQVSLFGVVKAQSALTTCV